MSAYHLAQINIAHLKAPTDDPIIADFVADLDNINQLAEQSEGFVWRLKDETGDATSFNPYDDPSYIINMSVWQDTEVLKEFVYGSNHVQIYMKRAQWCHSMDKAHMTLWWIPTGHTLSLAEAIERLALIDKVGNSKEAFTFKKTYGSP